MIYVRFRGTCSVRRPDGFEVIPRAAKEQALLLLICDAPGGRRARRWLEAMLWSDSPPARASGSLRQALINLRRLGMDAVLGADRSDIWIDTAKVLTDLTDGASDDGNLLEGIDAGDEAFEEWLRERRARVGAPRPCTPAIRRWPAIALRPSENVSGIDWITSRMLGLRIATEVADLMAGTCYDTPQGGETGITIECHVSSDNANQMVSFRCLHEVDGRVIYSGDLHFARSEDGQPNADWLATLSHGISMRLARRISQTIAPEQPAFLASGLLDSARRNLMAFTPEARAMADRQLCQAYDLAPDGVFLAYRALNGMIGSIEDRHSDEREAAELVQMLGRKALESPRCGGHARALVALAMLMAPDGDCSDKAVSLLPLVVDSDTVTSRLVRALLTSWHGDHAKAIAHSGSAMAAVGDDDLLPLWHLYHCLIAAAAGEMQDAILAGERAVCGRPSFQGALRQMVVLYGATGDRVAAQASFGLLRNAEAEVTIEALLQDPDYPVTTMRRAGILDRAATLLSGRTDELFHGV